jgi:ABC-type multidrug transport system ATPase subunit
MSEEILKALMELFALIVKQDGGMLENERAYVLSFLRKQLTHEAVDQYMELFDSHAGQITLSKSISDTVSPSVKDSIKILSICKKINRTLNQEQKIVVLTRLYEIVNSDKQFTVQRMNIINTVAEVFRVTNEEIASIDQFVRHDSPELLVNQSILMITDDRGTCDECSGLKTGFRDTIIAVLRIPRNDIYFLKYISDIQLYLNGLPIYPGNIYFFASGSSIRSEQGKPLYYTDIVSKFLEESTVHKLTLVAEELTCRFSDGNTAVNEVSFSVQEGKLIGILGASGSGKTTLLNILSGMTPPTSGEVRINGLNVHESRSELEGVIGFVPQDDMLIESLTVFENIYFAAALSFRDKTKKEITELAEKILLNLGLYDKRSLRVGSTMNKVISGGQRKRLNIALELIREPAVLFLDEPTSGLSSRDSENVMDLLRELTLKGKLVITVIHQPSSVLFKMFDRVIILDNGGYLTYYGNPVESIIHFKKQDAQINSTLGECPSCGNVNPETIFQIMETHVVDEFGRYTPKRKVSPKEWNSAYRDSIPFESVTEVTDPPQSNLKKPGRLKQLAIFLSRDLRSKISNKQYLALTLLEAPVLGFILSYIIRYIADPASDVYIFADNENIPIYIFMSIIVALFLGLIVSAEEIFRDRIVLKRERFLNLSRSSYLLSKVLIMAFISAFQVATFLLVANNILEVKGLFFNYFMALFATAFCANMIGLNISASLNSAITIYIIIPLLMIPMMVLSGAMFPFDKLNRTIGSVDKVPVIAELMPTRWTYEALMVTQFKDNAYGHYFYNFEKALSIAYFNQTYRLIELEKAVASLRQDYENGTLTAKNQGRLLFVINETDKVAAIAETGVFTRREDLTPERFNHEVGEDLSEYLASAREWFRRLESANDRSQDNFKNLERERIRPIEEQFHNVKLKDIVTKAYEPNKSFEYRNRLIQNFDPIYMDPEPGNIPGFRTHFFAPSKYFFGRKTDTLVFNVGLVLFSTLILYLLLYFDTGSRITRNIERIKLRKKR